MKHLLPTLLILIAVVGLRASIIDQWQTYTWPDNSFSFQYPPGWHVYPESEDEIFVLPEDERAVIMAVREEMDYLDGNNVQTLSEEDIADILETFVDNARVQYREFVRINGVEWLRFRIAALDQEIWYKGDLYIHVSNSRCLAISLASEAALFESLEGMFMQIRQSMVFGEKLVSPDNPNFR